MEGLVLVSGRGQDVKIPALCKVWLNKFGPHLEQALMSSEDSRN